MWDISSVLVQCSSTLCWRGKKKKKKKERETTKGLIEEVEDEKREFKVMGIKHNLQHVYMRIQSTFPIFPLQTHTRTRTHNQDEAWGGAGSWIHSLLFWLTDFLFRTAMTLITTTHLCSKWAAMHTHACTHILLIYSLSC